MTPLMQIRDVVQQFAEAFSAALKVDVEVFDQNQRIAGTGAAERLIGEPLLPMGIIAKRIFKEGLKRFIFENPGQQELCVSCPRRNACHYKKAVHASLEYEGQIIGIIGIVAENEEQVRLIEYNNYAMLDLVDKIANLITAKVKEHETLKQLATFAELMHSVTNTINKGIFILNRDFTVVDINDYLVDKLMLDRRTALGQHINAILPSLDLYKEKSKDFNHYFQEVSYTANNKQIYLLCNIKSIVVNQELVWIVCFVEDCKDTAQLAYAITTKQNDIRLSDIITSDPQFLKFKDKVKNVASHDSTVLLIGETGTGKELFVRAIHAESERKNHPFIAINCGAIPESLMESELFGYEKGAFTGANHLGKHGRFFMANKGTLFLDEIETLPLYLQPKLLRAIERKEIERIGGVKPIPIDVRIIAATNVRLDEMVKKKEFREDLFYRLNVVALFIPPLRERGNDVLVLANHFIVKFAEKFGKDIRGLSDEVRDIFLHYSWPGNVRELQNAIEYAINMEASNYITVDNLPVQFQGLTFAKTASTLGSLELDKIKMALDQFGWSEEGKAKAAQYLGISRSTIYRKIKKYQLRPQ